MIQLHYYVRWELSGQGAARGLVAFSSDQKIQKKMGFSLALECGLE